MPPRRKKAEEGSKGAPLWMATFSDLVTLMMAFFVMLVAMANFEDVKRIEAVVESIRTALGVDGYDNVLVASSKETQFTESTRRDQTIQPVVAKIRQALSKHVSDDFVQMVEHEKELRIRLDERVFFQRGSSRLHPAAYALVADLGSMLAAEDVDISVQGFADGSGGEQANWELSSRRAIAVVMALREKGPIPGERLEAVAHGSFHPGSGVGEASDWSRRVEIVLKTENLAGAGAASQLME